MTVKKETIKILDDLMYQFQCSVDDGLNSNDKDAIEALVSNQEVVMALNIAKKSVKAWDKVLKDIGELEEHDYCRCEGVNIPPMVDKGSVLAIIKECLSEVNI